MSLIPSFAFSLFWISAVVSLTSYLNPLAYDNGSIIARILFLLIIAPIVLVVLLGIYALIVILLVNAYHVLKKESRSLSNALTFLLAIGLICFLAAEYLMEVVSVPRPLGTFIFFAYGMLLFYFFHFIHYVVATILCNFSRPKLNQHYIIVPGSGLIDGKVPPLLAGRMDKAILFYHKQRKETEAPKLVLSGGQGSDEPRPEALAMMEYALSKDVEACDILLEDKSKTTLQNMMFSKEIMDTHSKGKQYNCIYATSNYHLLRTGIYAKMVGLKIEGIGSKTALYYLPNALIREYIAYIVMHKKRNIVFILITFLFVFVLNVVFYVYGLL